MNAPAVLIPDTDTWPAPDDPTRLTIELDHSEPPPMPADLQRSVDRAWNGLLSRNPRMYDAPVLAVIGEDLKAGRIRCRLDSFKRLAVQGTVKTGVELLAVSGIIVARDAHGREHVFLGKRHPQTRVYGNMWEVGPSGGVPPPAVTRNMTLADVVRQLGAEMHEEAGLTLDPRTATLAGICRDHLAHSLDVLIRVDPAQPLEQLHTPEADRDWEYADIRWLPLEELARFDRENAAQIIAPTRAAFRLLGWVTG